MSIEILELDEVHNKLGQLLKVLSPAQMKTTMDTIGNMVQNVIEESFENQSDPWGRKWESLKASTIKEKKRRGKSSSILRRDDVLADTWQTHATSDSVEVAGNAKSKDKFEYGAVHQWGSKKTSGRGSGIVARAFLPIDAGGEIERGLAEDIEQYLEEKLTKALEANYPLEL